MTETDELRSAFHDVWCETQRKHVTGDAPHLAGQENRECGWQTEGHMRAVIRANRTRGIDHDGERDALAAGTHEPAVDDFGNQYLARTSPTPPSGDLAATHVGSDLGYAAVPVAPGVVHDPECCAARGCHRVCSHLCGTDLASPAKVAARRAALAATPTPPEIDCGWCGRRFGGPVHRRGPCPGVDGGARLTPPWLPGAVRARDDAG